MLRVLVHQLFFFFLVLVCVLQCAKIWTYIFSFDPYGHPLRQELPFFYALDAESEGQGDSVTLGLKPGFKPSISTPGQSIPILISNMTITALGYGALTIY